MRRTTALIKVASVLMEDPGAQHWGYDVSRRAKLRSGVLYPVLKRMLESGWLTDGWEDREAITEKRPPRRYYELTPLGATELSDVLTAAASAARSTVQATPRIA